MYVVFDKNTSTGSMEPGLGGRGMSCPLSASTRSHLSQVRGSGLSLSRVWYRSKQMTTEVLSPVFPSHKPFVHRSYPWVSCLQHRGDELWCQRAQHLLPPGCQPLPGFWTALGAQLMLGIPGFQHHPKDSSTIPKVLLQGSTWDPHSTSWHPALGFYTSAQPVLTRGSTLVLRLNPLHHRLH